MPAPERVAAVILARFDSRRLPGKALADLDGAPLLDRVVARVRRATRIDAIVVATSDRAVDEPIARRARQLGVACFRGATEDVASRFVAAAGSEGCTIALRVNGDSPFVDPELLDEAVALLEATGSDVATTQRPRCRPYGIAAEAIRVAVLARLLESEATAEEREHVTAVLYRVAATLRIADLPPPATPAPSLRLTVDEPADLVRIAGILRALEERGVAPEMATVADLLALPAETLGP